MAEEDTHPALRNHPIDPSYIRGVEGTETHRERDMRRLDYRDWEELGNHRDASTGSTEAPIDRSHLHGDGWHDFHTEWDHTIDQGPQEHDGRATTRTGFNPYDSDDPEKFKRLLEWQEDRWDPDHHTQQRYAGARRDMKTFTSQLGMTKYQTERCVEILESVNTKHMAHYTVEIVSLAIISLVANEDNRWIRDEAKFRKLMLDLGATLRDVRKCRRLVKAKSDVI